MKLAVTVAGQENISTGPYKTIGGSHIIVRRERTGAVGGREGSREGPTQRQRQCEAFRNSYLSG